jgi:hypothetical protein
MREGIAEQLQVLETVAEAVVRKANAGRWTEAERARYASMARERSLWKKSTGPRTAEGKRRVGQNARKKGSQSWEEQQLIRSQLRCIKALLARA